LTQVQVAKALRKPQTWVSKFELGERRVDAVEFGDFCRQYGKPPRYFRTSYQGCRADYPAAPPWCFARYRCRAPTWSPAKQVRSVQPWVVLAQPLEPEGMLLSGAWH
jgi:hypothetical protein